MAGFDYDAVVIGSGFGGSVAAFRAAEKGYRVGVMESGKRWKDEDIPKTVYPGSPSSARPAVLLSLSGDGPLPRARQLGLLEG
jgi:choline dehydrogenase-like flavoprotein